MRYYYYFYGCLLSRSSIQSFIHFIRVDKWRRRKQQQNVTRKYMMSLEVKCVLYITTTTANTPSKWIWILCIGTHCTHLIKNSFVWKIIFIFFLKFAMFCFIFRRNVYYLTSFKHLQRTYTLHTHTLTYLQHTFV